MLGLVHRTVLGKGPKQFQRFFCKQGEGQAASFWTRGAAKRQKHGRQLEEVPYPHCPELLRRSAFGLVKVYNMLPAHVVRTSTVKDFQSNLQEFLKERARSGCEDWAATFSPRVHWYKHPLRAYNQEE